MAKSFRPRTRDAFCLWLQAHGLPVPVKELRFHDTRRWRFDYGWWTASIQVAVEVEGGAFTRGRHTRGKGFVNDLEKYNAATILGWKVLRYTPDQLTTPQTLADLKEVLS